MFFRRQCFPIAVLCSIPIISVADATNVESPLGLPVDDNTENIVVVGSRTERVISEVAATVDVKTAEQIERELSQNLADLFRFEPGLSSAGTGSRFGFGGFNIRGIGGNRVLTIIDGVRIPEEFSFGPFLSARRNFIDVDSLSRAEVARGPISSLYGSDALGGVVALRTKSPSDYIGNDIGDDKTFYGGFKVAGTSVDNGSAARLSLATGNENLAGLVVYNFRERNETETQGNADILGPQRSVADPQDVEEQNVLIKLESNFADYHELVTTIDYYENETDTRILSDYNTSSRGVLVTRRDAIDSRDRIRGSLAYEYNKSTVVADKISVTSYFQNSDTEQLTDENRIAMGNGQLRIRDSQFTQKIFGAFAQVEKKYDADNHAHHVIYGAEYTQTDNETLRFGQTTDVNTGENIREFFPFPTRDFPLTTVKQYAVFIQDEISFFDHRLIISPSIRYDNYSADATADEVFTGGNPGTPLPEGYDDDAFSSKLGVVYKFDDTSSAYVRYSEGFRAPPYDDVNVGFTNLIGGYKTISNANLESETSQGVEIGYRFQSASKRFHIALFKNNYDNFIQSQAIAPQFISTMGVDPNDGLLTFQSINREEVIIEGVEISGELDLGSISNVLSGFTTRAAIAYADGEDRQISQPLNSIEPLSSVFGISYEPSLGNWGVDLLARVVDEKDVDDIDPSEFRLPTAGYGVIDLLAFWKPSDNLRINLGLFNLSDKTYVRWADTIAIGNDNPLRFSQPGLSAAASLSLEI